jgi:DnaK suppressor protein
MEESAVRDLLVAERATTLARIAAMSSEFDDVVEATAGANSDDEHDPEGSTIAFERAQISALLQEARASLTDLDDAIVRLDAGTYGVCERCGGSVAPDRLAARPATRTCIGCAATS